MFKINHSHFLKSVLLGFLLSITIQNSNAQTNTDYAFQTVVINHSFKTKSLPIVEIDWKTYFSEKLDKYYVMMKLDSVNSSVWAYCALTAWMRSYGDNNLIQENIKENVSWIKMNWTKIVCPCEDVIPDNFWNQK